MNKILIIAALVAVFATAAYAQCNSSNAAQCGTDYQSCVLGAGLDVNKICACYGPYFSCLRNINCLTDAEYNNIKQSCSNSGCTAAQCSSAVSISGVFGLFVAAVAAFF